MSRLGEVTVIATQAPVGIGAVRVERLHHRIRVII